MSVIQWPKTIALSEIDKIRIEAAHDRTFRERLLADPATVLASRGVEIPAGLKVQAVADTPDTYHLTVPPFVGQDTSNALAAKANNSSTWYCTTCTTTTPICIGSLASLTCIA
jgi:hypothetical protein